MKTRQFRRAFLVAIVIAIQSLSCVAQHSSRSQENALLSAAKTASDKDDSSLVRALEPKALAVVNAGADRQGDSR